MSALNVLDRESNLIFDVFNDKSGRTAIAIKSENDFFFVTDKDADYKSLIENLFYSEGTLVCFDVRKVLKFGIKLHSVRVIYDVKLLYDEKDLWKLLKTSGSDLELLKNAVETNKQFDACIRACKTAKMDLSKHSLLDLLPIKVIHKLFEQQLAATKILFDESKNIDSYKNDLYPFARALYNTELNKIKVDLPLAEECISRNENPISTRFFKTVKNQAEDGYVMTAFNPCGGKTGRIKIDGASNVFNCMAIPHGISRKAIISRFDGGMIHSFDYNAMDYRCIVRSIEDEAFRNLYADCADFHSRTASFLFGSNVDQLRRDIVKSLSYIYIYGGSVETVSLKTGLSLKKAQKALDMLDKKLEPLKHFRRCLYETSLKVGHTTLPNGRKVIVDAGSHEGKVLGLYAQAYSSYIFEKSFVEVESLLRSLKSKILFTVHDEIVVDVHPDEFAQSVNIIRAMEHNGEFKVNMSKGKNYYDATDR